MCYIRFHFILIVANLVLKFRVLTGENISILHKTEQPIDFLAVKTAECDFCGMTFFGALSFKICSDVQCCYTPWLQGGFTEGGIDFFENSNLGECGNEFKLRKNESIPIMEVTIFHQGTDGVGVEYTQIEMKEGNRYRCSFTSELIDKQRFATSNKCWFV